MNGSSSPKASCLLALIAGLFPFFCGCGPEAAPPPSPEITFLAASAAPYRAREAFRLDLRADLSNPTPEHLGGCYLELELPGAVQATLEFGDLEPRAEATAFRPLKLRRPVTADDLLGAPARVVRPEGRGSLPEVWYLERIENATLGYSRGGEKVTRDLTADLREALPGWLDSEAGALRHWRQDREPAAEPQSGAPSRQPGANTEPGLSGPP